MGGDEDGVVDDGIGRGMSRRALLGAALLGVVAGCASTGPAGPLAPGASPGPTRPAAPVSLAPGAAVDAVAVRGRATVPVLCWHQLRDWRPDDSAYARASLICPPAAFRGQLDALTAAGHSAIGPDDYLAHLVEGAPLPPNPVLLSFDDSQGSQITVALPELRRRALTATFFVMTVPSDKPNWMSRDDVRRLHGEGMTVTAHTYDHHRADRYTDADWELQLDRPRAELKTIIGAPVRHFAYPYGAWSAEDFAHLDSAGYVTGFQLADKPVDPTRPLLTLRRSLAGSTWAGPQTLAATAHPS